MSFYAFVGDQFVDKIQSWKKDLFCVLQPRES